MIATSLSDLDEALGRIDRHAPFLRRTAAQRPEILAALAEGGLAAALAKAADTPPDMLVTKALRRERQGVALAVAAADLAGVASLEQVVRALSDFADNALDRAIKAAIAERYPDAEPRGFAALALGKHGSRELNYSSDIDPILIFDPDTLPRRASEEPVEAAVRIGQRVSDILQTRDADGYVFRVDLRLRPSPEATPLALPVGGAISYYESSALPWERAAFIRARAAAGDIALGSEFLSAIKPFVWRRAVDYGAVNEIRGISRRIRDHHAQGQLLGPGFDLKRGRGGIREIEFFAQIHQLIHGGREPALRAPATLDALAALAAAGRISADEERALAAAYGIHRTIEHRLQMVEDQQTHRLPKQPDELDNVARLHGLIDGAALIDLLAPHIDAVGAIYDGLDADRPTGLSHDPDLLQAALSAAGFPDAANARARIETWRSGIVRAVRTPAAREALEAVLPSLIEALGRAPDPNQALNRFDMIVTKLPTAINLFRLLEARPALARMVGDVLIHAPTLAEALGRRPALLEGLIDATAFDDPGGVDDIAVAFAQREQGDDYQILLDRVRAKVGERRFALGVQLIEGVADPIAVGTGYGHVAEAAVRTLTDATVVEFEKTHGRIGDSGLVILALGRLGGGVLTHASDLDLIYLFQGDHLGESNGPKPLGATHYFNRLAQRVTAGLSVPTAAGPLYEIDTRLRPSGAQGLLAVSIESFAKYQRESAWTWEHMALTRARPIYGSDDALAEVRGVIGETLLRPRDPDALIADAVKMRGDMAKHKPPQGPFDVKLIEGGLVDCEFAVHVTQLRHGKGLNPRLSYAIAELIELGLVAPELRAAHDLMTRMLVTMRLASPQSSEPLPLSQPIVARACGAESWKVLIEQYGAARAVVSAEWARVTGRAVG